MEGVFWEGGFIMKLSNACPVFICAALFCSVPAEAADGSSFSNVGIIAMVVGVAVLAFAMKKFME